MCMMKYYLQNYQANQVILNFIIDIKLTMQSAADICAICEKQPEDLLVLVCSHNLCVECATQVYTLNGGVNPFICQICLAETDLDAQTISHFQAETKRIQVQPKKSQVVQKPPKQKSPQKKEQSHRNICRTHNEAAIYYCYQCNTADICSQCILTPKHNTHKVLTIKKAFQALGKKLEEQIKSCEIIKSQLNQQRDYFFLKKKQYIHEYSEKKEQIKEIFDEIARAVSESYASVSCKIDEFKLKSEQIFEAHLIQIQEKQKTIENSIKFQKRALISTNQSVLIDYSANWTSHKDVLTVGKPPILPNFSFNVDNLINLSYQIVSVLNKYSFARQQNYEQIQCSMISITHQQNQKNGLKQSYHGGGLNLISRSQNKMAQSRKLELSRSLQNATSIINRLQQRSKNA